jgi:tetratricopeptide (TPR) repeat protein/DNA-binding HxlR family transcriptional regulator
MGSINYPPEKIYSPSKLKKPNYDHIILWMLFNNEECKWSDFRQEPIEIPTGTLSRHLENLKRKDFVENFSRGYYRITSEGKKKFYELSSAKKKARKLNYPPEIILKSGRNYSHWILWMVYNNNYCKRGEFLEDPLSINQSSLSKNLNLLMEKGFVVKEDGRYIITQAGKSEYSRMLGNYDLDRQTILEEEGKRIEELTKKTIEFFDKFKIKDKEIQFRFLNNILKLNYEKVKPLLKDELLFYKIILFLSINHPDQYPEFIIPEDFSRIYEIKKTTLDYYTDEISEGKIYPIRFFKLKQPSGEQYYFQSDGALEKMLRVITENKITKISYLNKLFSKPTPYVPVLDMESLITDIVNKSCEFLFNKNLKESITEFLPEYIKYLAYKIEIKKELKETYDKLEGIIWQNITDIFQSQIYKNLKEQYEDQIEEINKEIMLNPDNLDLYYMKIKVLIYFNQYKESIRLLDEMSEIFLESEKDIKILKAAVLRRMQNIKAGLEIIESLIEKYPKDNDLISYKAYWLQFLDKKEEAIKIIQKLIEMEPERGIYHDTYGEILMYFEDYEEAAKKFVKSMILGSKEWYIFQTYIKLGICYKTTGELDLAVKNLKKGIELTKKNVKDPETKQKWLVIANLFLSELRPLEVNPV